MIVHFHASEIELNECLRCTRAHDIDDNFVSCPSETCDTVLKQFPSISPLFKEENRDQQGALLQWVEE